MRMEFFHMLLLGSGSQPIIVLAAVIPSSTYFVTPYFMCSVDFCDWLSSTVETLLDQACCPATVNRRGKSNWRGRQWPVNQSDRRKDLGYQKILRDYLQSQDDGYALSEDQEKTNQVGFIPSR
jgi:hypothetical protein